MPEQALEHRLDVVARPEDALKLGAPATDSQDDEVANRGVTRAFAVDDERPSAREVRLAHEELPAAGKLGDNECLGWRR
jgi:hypothetical protein